MKLLLSLALIFCLITTYGCSSKAPQKPTHPTKRTIPSKQLPARSKIPPTQKPYRVFGKKYYPIPSAYGHEQTGVASWYGTKFHGRKTSNGETYDMYSATAAHKTLPMNSNLLVKNLENGKETIVRVNDRGPFVKGRIIDLSLKAARAINMENKGTAKVRITALGEAVTTARGEEKIERFLPYQDFQAGEFFVQIGSFTNKSNADRLKNRMLSQGRKAVSQGITIQNTLYYRVQVRAGRTLAEAQKAEHDLEGSYPGAFVIAR